MMEIARFGVVRGVQREQVVKAAQQMQSWLAAQDGFVSRCLVGPDAEGWYADVVRWRSMDDAQAAMAAMEQSPQVGSFMALIDPERVRMEHLPVALDQ